MLKLLILLPLIMVAQAAYFAPTCFDFSDGIPSNIGTLGAGVTWTRAPYNDVKCAVRGVLQLTPPNGAYKLKVHMDIKDSSSWTYNLGDSPTCNGYSGDSGSSPYGYNAEFQETSGTVRFYKGISSPDPNALVETYNASPTHPITYEITRGTVSATDYNGWHYKACTNYYRLFYWNPFYLGINRVIHSYTSTSVSGNRVGSGMCKVCIEWE